MNSLVVCASVVVVAAAPTLGATAFNEGFESSMLPAGYFFEAGDSFSFDFPMSGGNPGGFLRGETTTSIPFFVLDVGSPEANGDYIAGDITGIGIDLSLLSEGPEPASVGIDFNSISADRTATIFRDVGAWAGPEAGGDPAWLGVEVLFDPSWTTSQAEANGWEVYRPTRSAFGEPEPEFSDLMQDVAFVTITLAFEIGESRTVEVGFDNVRLLPPPGTLCIIAPVLAIRRRR